ncbi:MAG: alternative ribosome rescue aminoacyl-tRNA hydrolase ArfB [Flavobacteriaceae bacterium]|nr:aminoacyl-tRNA hydrolase [Flavobacteriaceae bacterium]
MDIEKILSEVTFKAIKSSGPGGQHVNKTASKVEISFNVLTSEGLSENEKELLQKRLDSKLSLEGILVLQCGETRSQFRNKKLIIDRLVALVTKNVKVKKVRKSTKPSKSVIEKRLKTKKENALKKAYRKPPKID